MNGVVSNFREVFVVFEYVWDLIFPREFDLLRKRIWVFHFWDLNLSFLSALFFWDLIFLGVDLSITETFIFCELIFQRVDLSQNWSVHFLLVYFFNHFWGLIFSWVKLSFSESWSFHFWVSHFLGFCLSEIWEYISISDSHIFCDLIFIFIVVYLAISERTIFSENWYFSDLIFPLQKLTFLNFWDLIFPFLNVRISKSWSFREFIFHRADLSISEWYICSEDWSFWELIFSNTESFISETWWFHFRNVKCSWEEMFVRADGFIYECTSFWNKYLSGSWSIHFWVCHFLRVDRFIFWRFNFFWE